MSFVVYFFVLLIAGCSVLFGLDWVQAPMSPMPKSPYELRAAKVPEPPRAAVAAAQPVAVPAPTAAPVSASAPAAVPIVAAVEQPATPVIAPPQPVAAAEPVPVAAAPTPKCDIDACTSAYRSFDAADCTYQPSDGPRRLCTKGTPPNVSAAQTSTVPDAQAQAACNVAACSQAYVSFSASDCTYQPLEGARRLCTK